MNKKKVLVGIGLGALLGIFCVIGMSARLNLSYTDPVILGTWLNRVVLGLVLGLLPTCGNWYKVILKGLLVGLFIGFTLYVATAYLDIAGLFAAGVYGIIIELVLFKLFKDKNDLCETNCCN